MLRPRTIGGIEHVADVDAILSAIEPFRLTNPEVLSMHSDEITVKYRGEVEKQLMKILDGLGF